MRHHFELLTRALGLVMGPVFLGWLHFRCRIAAMAIVENANRGRGPGR